MENEEEREEKRGVGFPYPKGLTIGFGHLQAGKVGRPCHCFDFAKIRSTADTYPSVCKDDLFVF